MGSRSYFSSAVAMALAVGAFAVLWMLLVPSDKTFTVDSREVIEYRVLEGGVVEYAYKGEALPEKIVEDEEVALRTESSYTRKTSGGAYEARIYSGKSFVADDEGWRYRETATTTQEEFASAARANPFAFLSVQRAYAVDVYSAAGDDDIGNSGALEATFSAARSLASASVNPDGSNTIGKVMSLEHNSAGTTGYEIDRAFLPFDTSSLPVGAVISAASLSVHVTSTADEDNDAQAYITVVETSQADHTSPVGDDFDQVGATEAISSGTRKDITSIVAAEYLTFALNSTGIGFIKTNGQASSCSASAGITCLGLREGHDFANSSIALNTDNFLRFKLSETSGTSQDPYLSITYTAPVTITTDAASSLTSESATLNATISDTGGDGADTCGFAWGTNSSLSGGDTATTTDATCPGTTGSFSTNLNSLVFSTSYYFRAYAINSIGTGYGSIQTFVTQDPPPSEMRLKGGVRLQGSRLLGL